MLEYKAQVAFDLVPLMEYLYDGGRGVLDISGDSVHLAPLFFHEVFPEIISAVPNGSTEYPFRWTRTVEHEGRKVEFFALSKTGTWEDEE